MRLLALLPDGAVRPLYARAREWADARGVHRREDPLATLRAYCRELLPLPPYRAWVADVVRNPGAYADDLAPDPGGEGVRDEAEPVTVDVRGVRHRGRSWYARLNLVPDSPGWSGFISFSPGDAAGASPSATYRTADVFREETAEAVRERFADFDEAALGAFLRSILP